MTELVETDQVVIDQAVAQHRSDLEAARYQKNKMRRLDYFAGRRVAAEFLAAEVAHHAVSRAIKQGLLIRPIVCECCERSLPPLASGHARIIGHHYLGHEPPYQLIVTWVCKRCHAKIDTDILTAKARARYSEAAKDA